MRITRYTKAQSPQEKIRCAFRPAEQCCADNRSSYPLHCADQRNRKCAFGQFDCADQRKQFINTIPCQQAQATTQQQADSWQSWPQRHPKTSSSAGNEGMMVTYQNCLSCGLRYMQVDSIAHRNNGYCTEECSYHEKRSPPTAEDIGWKNGIAASTQRKKYDAPQTCDVAPRQWTFDLFRVPHPLRPITGAWELVNWRLCDAKRDAT